MGFDPNFQLTPPMDGKGRWHPGFLLGGCFGFLSGAKLAVKFPGNFHIFPKRLELVQTPPPPPYHQIAAPVKKKQHTASNEGIPGFHSPPQQQHQPGTPCSQPFINGWESIG